MADPLHDRGEWFEIVEYLRLLAPAICRRASHLGPVAARDGSRDRNRWRSRIKQVSISLNNSTGKLISSRDCISREKLSVAGFQASPLL